MYVQEIVWKTSTKIWEESQWIVMKHLEMTDVDHFFFLRFIYLTLLGSSCGIWDLRYVMWHLLLWHMDCLVVVCRLSSSIACGIWVPWPGIEPASPALQAGFLTTGPLGKSLGLLQKIHNFIIETQLPSTEGPHNTVGHTEVLHSMWGAGSGIWVQEEHLMILFQGPESGILTTGTCGSQLLSCWHDPQTRWFNRLMKGKQSWIIGIQDGNQDTGWSSSLVVCGLSLLPRASGWKTPRKRQYAKMSASLPPLCSQASSQTKQNSVSFLSSCELLHWENRSIHIWMLQHDVGNLPRDLSMEDKLTVF